MPSIPFAYGPEAALTLLIPLGAAGIAHIVPIFSNEPYYLVLILAIIVHDRIRIGIDSGSCVLYSDTQDGCYAELFY